MIKYYPDKTGRFIERPHYDPKDLDYECEVIVCGFLRELYGSVAFPIATDDITKLIEKYASDLNVYANLSKYGENVEGVTEFFQNKKPIVMIAEKLSVSEFGENRLRTTMTHELGHVVFHGYLYQSMLQDPKSGAVQICKRDDIIAKSTVPGINWMEWQAGYACGAFLMPASHVKRAVSGVTQKSDSGVTSAESAVALIARVVEAFHVSEEAARVRLSVLGHIIR